MRFWDSSAIVPVLIEEPGSSRTRALAEDGSELAVWWATVIECLSAVARRERSGEIDVEEASFAIATLDGLSESWSEIPPTEALRSRTRRLVRLHDVRTADAFQLAAALVAADDRPESLPFVTLDERLALAARREGFSILP